MVMVGPYNDGGWNQSHYEAGKYVESKIPGAKMIYIDKVNPADKPNVTIPQVVDELIAQGAKFIITNSAEFADGTVESARNHPDVFFIHASGDSVLKGNAPANMGNLMGRMEYGKMLSGCAAALQTEAGKISYLGPLIDPETRRLVNSAYLGARYCWEQVRGKPAADLKFDVTWIGFWFNIPGVTLDPTKVVNDFFNSGSDVVMSGIDTTEALVEANKASQAGKKVFAAPYDFKDACKQAEQVCLGVPYFNWGPEYAKLISAAQQGQFKQSWDWVGPDPKDMNNLDTSIVGYVTGQALSDANKAELEKFRAKLLSGEVNLFTGPLKYQDGSVFVEAGKTATDQQIWYTEQLLEGIVGQSAAPQQ
ncbi:MAG: BMP family ABC transporter substrate-binding protein [Roseiflexaceae bacterium]